METTNETRIANVVFEDRLFLRRLERTLNAEFERTNKLLAEQVILLETRKQLLAEVQEAVQQRWATEEKAEKDATEAVDRKMETEERSIRLPVA